MNEANDSLRSGLRREEKLGLVLPTLREAASLPILIPRIQAELDPLGIGYELLVVDDDSRDGTESFVSMLAGTDPRIRLLIRSGKRGLAGAVLYGWRHTDATILGVMDADGQHPPELLPELLKGIRGGRDLAVASRFVAGGGWPAASFLRRLMTAVAICLTQPLRRRVLGVCDPLSGYFLVRRSCVDKQVFQTAGFKLLLEILASGRVRSVAEVPFRLGKRGAGKSKVGMGVAMNYLRLLARLYAARWRAGIPQESGGD